MRIFIEVCVFDAATSLHFAKIISKFWLAAENLQTVTPNSAAVCASVIMGHYF